MNHSSSHFQAFNFHTDTKKYTTTQQHDGIIKASDLVENINTGKDVNFLDTLEVGNEYSYNHKSWKKMTVIFCWYNKENIILSYNKTKFAIKKENLEWKLHPKYEKYTLENFATQTIKDTSNVVNFLLHKIKKPNISHLFSWASSKMKQNPPSAQIEAEPQKVNYSSDIWNEQHTLYQQSEKVQSIWFTTIMNKLEKLSEEQLMEIISKFDYTKLINICKRYDDYSYKIKFSLSQKIWKDYIYYIYHNGRRLPAEIENRLKENKLLEKKDIDYIFLQSQFQDAA